MSSDYFLIQVLLGQGNDQLSDPMNNLPHSPLHPLQSASALDSRFRLLFQSPGKILSKYIQQGMTVLDLGCGTGFFTLEIAKLVGEEGKVIAADVQIGMLKILKGKLENCAMQNKIQIHHNQENALALTEKVDFILAFYSFHEMRNIDNIIRELQNIAKPETRILISEQMFHVSRNTFQLIIQKMEKIGFIICGKPGIFLSRSVLMKLKNT